MWNQEKIQSYIDNEQEENLQLDYKAADSLRKDDKKKGEITKDVSAMANSAGGVIIYGVKEHTDVDRKHLPERIDPIDRKEFSKEWLEHVVGSIQPRIPDVNIYPVSISGTDNGVVYVVEIPLGITAHQANSKKFYRRYNFESKEMAYHEITDVMGRSRHPVIKLDFGFETKTVISYSRDIFPSMSTNRRIERSIHSDLEMVATNEGGVFAKYVNIVLDLPAALLDETGIDIGDGFRRIIEDNTKRDIIGWSGEGYYRSPNYGPSWYAPILPQRKRIFDVKLIENIRDVCGREDLEIRWKVFADNAPPIEGSIKLSEIPLIESIEDKTKKS